MKRSLQINPTILACAIAALLGALPSAKAASATWNGTTDGLWATTTNWSASPVPGVGDTATFNNAGNGNTTITVGTISITQALFDTASAAAYTLGGGTINFATGTTTAVSMTAAVTTNQTINANLTLGTAVASNTTFNNASAAGLLTLGGNITGGTGGTAAAKTLTFTGAGNTTVLGNIASGTASGLVLDKRAGAGMLTLSGTNAFASGFSVGTAGGAGGTVRLASGGNITTAAGVRMLLGLNAGQSGTLTMDAGAGTVTFGGNRGSSANYIGVDGGTGTVNANGGTLNFTGMANGSGHVLIGANGGTSNGTMTVAGATVNVGTRIQMGSGYPGDGAAGWVANANGNATLTISSGAMNIGTAAAGDTDIDKGFLYLKSPTGGTGTATVHLDGGTLSLAKFQIGAGGTSRVINFHGGTVRARASRADFLGTGATLNVKDNGAVIDSNTFDITIAGNLVNGGTGVGGLTKNSAGLLNLSGINSYGGATTVNAGGLAASGTYAGGFTFANNTRLVPRQGAVGTLTVPTLSLGTGMTFDYEFSAGGATNDTVVIGNAGGLTFNGGGFNLYNEGAVTPFGTNGTYTLFDYTTSFTGSLAGISILNAQAGKFYTLADDVPGTAITLTIADSAISDWSGGGGDGLWTTSGNWSGGVPNAAGATAKFGTTPGAPTSVAVDGPKTVGGIVFDNANSYTVTGSATDVITLDNGIASGSIAVASGSHTLNAPLALLQNLSITAANTASLAIGGEISGAGKALSIVGTGTGKVTLTGANSYSGGTTITSGTLELGNGGATGSIVGDVVNNGVLVFNRSDDFSYSATISGTGSVVKNGPNTLTLSATNGYTAGTTVNSGTLVATTGANLGSGTITLNGGNLSATGNITRAVAVGASGGTLTVDTGVTFSTAALTGTATTLTKAGPGTLAITAGAGFGSTLNVDGGLVTFSGSGSLAASTAVAVASGATVRFSRNDTFGNHATAVSQTFTLNGGTIDNGGNFFTTLGAVTLNAGTINSTGGANANFPSFSLRGPITVGGSAASTISGSGANSQMLVGGSVANSQTTFDVADVTGDSAPDLNVSVPLQNNRDSAFAMVATGLIKTGVGTMTLSNTNTYTGNTTVSDGILVLADNAQLRFVLGATTGINNSLTGAGIAVLSGDFAIDTTAANSLTSGSWTLESVTSLAGPYENSFTVVNPDGSPWTDAGGNLWTKDGGGGKTWTFSELTGVLTLTQTANFASWAIDNGVTGGADGDSDFDGIPNLIEYALNLNFAGSDGSAGTFNNNLLSFTKRTVAVTNGDITYAIQESDDLGVGDPWATVTPTFEDATMITYQLPVGPGPRKFARLLITQNP